MRRRVPNRSILHGSRHRDSLMDRLALPLGTRFGEMEIVRVLAVGGFGIVYLARDHAM